MDRTIRTFPVFGSYEFEDACERLYEDGGGGRGIAGRPPPMRPSSLVNRLIRLEGEAGTPTRPRADGQVAATLASLVGDGLGGRPGQNPTGMFHSCGAGRRKGRPLQTQHLVHTVESRFSARRRTGPPSQPRPRNSPGCRRGG